MRAYTMQRSRSNLTIAKHVDHVLDAAKRGIEYHDACERFVHFRGMRRFDELDPRDRTMVRAFRDHAAVLNRFARELDVLTDRCAHDALADLTGTFDDAEFHEIVLVSGWVTKLVDMCVRDKWWKTLECAIVAYGLDASGWVDPKIPALLAAANERGFERTWSTW